MKTIKTIISLAVLLFFTDAAVAQSFKQMSSSTTKTAGELYQTADPAYRSNNQPIHMAGELQGTADPGYTNSNSMLERQITINPSQYKVGLGSNTQSAPSLAGSRPGGVIGPRPGGFGGGAPGGAYHGHGGNELNPIRPGDGGLTGKEDRPLGELAPIGNALVPLLLLLLGYAAFVIIRRYSRAEDKKA